MAIKLVRCSASSPFGPVCCSPGALPVATTPATALADYVAKKDDSYKWFKRSEGNFGTTKYVEIILTSQTWKDIVWKHQLFILKPEKCNVASKHALLFITGGGWKDELAQPGENKLPREAALRRMAKVVTPSPSCCTSPAADFRRKKEDQIIAIHRAVPQNTTRPGPCIADGQEASGDGCDAGGGQGGMEPRSTPSQSWASKRGWTTWLTGAADKRQPCWPQWSSTR
jgi:hypothetical protein